VVAHLLDRLAALDLDAVALNLHHGGALVERVIGPGPVYLREDWLRGTAGALRGAASFLSAAGDFLVVSGDGVHEIALDELIETHRRSGAAATVTVKRIERPETCAVVELADDGLVRHFVEKPAEPSGDLASIGAYCFSAEVIELIPDERPYDIAGELIPALLERGLPVASHATAAWWSDIGTPDDLLGANLAAARGDARVGHAEEARTQAAGTRIYAGSRIAADARVEAPAVIGPDASIGAGALVRGSLVLPGASVPAGTAVVDAIHGSGEDVLRSWLRSG
jgi:NDP-sugar pyrophosphorylase family protein